MITTKNLIPYTGDVSSIKNRAAHLVQGMAKCPLSETVAALIVFDYWNSPGTKGRNAHRWVSQFCGFESGASGKSMRAIIQVTHDGNAVKTKADLKRLMGDMPHDA
ncbi:MAG: hypothetical protein AB8G16_19420 [Gammaproteobacteria bacterium]